MSDKETNPKDAIGSEKLALDLVPDSMSIALASAFTEGALKYGRFNWRVMGAKASVYRAAGLRHFMLWWNGEDIDPDSGLPHLYKLAACVAILIDAEMNGVLVDDRPPSLHGLAEALGNVDTAVRKMRERYGERRPKHYTIEDVPAKYAPKKKTPRQILEEMASRLPPGMLLGEKDLDDMERERTRASLLAEAADARIIKAYTDAKE